MRKWGPLVAVCLGTFMLLLDVTIVIVALPDIAGELGASLTGLQWVIDVYALVLAALLLGAGAAADVLGRRRVYAAGTALFTLASVGCGLAPGTGALVAMRGVQGLGAAAMFATTLSLLGAAYRGRDRSFALGMWGAVSGAAAALGPVLGGVLTQGLGWEWIFFMNVPVGAVAIWLTLNAVAPDGARGTRRLDLAGAAAFALFAGATTYAAVRAGEEGWTSGRTLAVFGVAAVALVLFGRAERRAVDPLLDLSLLRRGAFVTVLVAGLAYNAAAFGVMPYVSVWLQTVLGLSPVRAGLALLPLAAVSFVVAAAGGRLLHGAQARFVLGGGLLLIGGGTLGQAVLDADSGWASLSAGLAVSGVGVGLVSPALGGAALASVPARHSGMAGGAVNTFRQLGFALGIAVFGTVATSRMTDVLHDGGAARELAGGGAAALRGTVPDEVLRTAFASGLDGALTAAGVLGLVGGLAALAWVRSPGPEAETEAKAESERDRGDGVPAVGAGAPASPGGA
ncbi:MFS transporter [Streptomyces sp. NPDC050504]|uniref:MFS transporter n=1 Tax=Streptomyces sp. NPDC050504 TaxID=3365618 RepID=UPI0037A0ACC6